MKRLGKTRNSVDWRRLRDEASRLGEQEQYSEAIRLAEKALRMARRTGVSEYPQIGGILCELGNLYQAQAVSAKEMGLEQDAKRLFAKATRFYRQSLEAGESAKKPKSADIFTVLGNYACLLANQGKHKEADRVMTLASAVAVPEIGQHYAKRPLGLARLVKNLRAAT